MSCLQNEVLLETLFEEALEEVTNNNHLQFNDDSLYDELVDNVTNPNVNQGGQS